MVPDQEHLEGALVPALRGGDEGRVVAVVS